MKNVNNLMRLWVLVCVFALISLQEAYAGARDAGVEAFVSGLAQDARTEARILEAEGKAAGSYVKSLGNVADEAKALKGPLFDPPPARAVAPEPPPVQIVAPEIKAESKTVDDSAEQAAKDARAQKEAEDAKRIADQKAADDLALTKKQQENKEFVEAQRLENERIAQKKADELVVASKKEQELKSLANNIDDFMGGGANIKLANNKKFVAVGDNGNRFRIDFDGHGYAPHAHIEVPKASSVGKYKDAPGTPHHIKFKGND